MPPQPPKLNRHQVKKRKKPLFLFQHTNLIEDKSLKNLVFPKRKRKRKWKVAISWLWFISNAALLWPGGKKRNNRRNKCRRPPPSLLPRMIYNNSPMEKQLNALCSRRRREKRKISRYRHCGRRVLFLRYTRGCQAASLYYPLGYRHKKGLYYEHILLSGTHTHRLNHITTTSVRPTDVIL